MRSLADFIGKPIWLGDSARCIGKVSDVLLDPSGDACLALLVRRSIWRAKQLLPFGDVYVSGGSAIVMRTTQRMMDVRAWRAHGLPVIRSAAIRNRRVMTCTGRDIGWVQDVFVDEHTGELAGYIVASEGAARLVARRMTLAWSRDVTLGSGALVVRGPGEDEAEAEGEQDAAD